MWTAAFDPSVLPVSVDHSQPRLFDLSRHAALFVVDEFGREHVAIPDDIGVLRLDVLEGTLREGPVGLNVRLDMSQAALPKLMAIDRLLRLLSVQIPDRRVSFEDRRLPRLIEAFRVIDALTQGASLLDIASGLAPETLLAEPWPGRGDHLKSRVRRRVSLARRLLTGGPSAILQHRI